MDKAVLFGETVHVYLDETSLKIARVKIASGKKTVAGFYAKSISGLPLEKVAAELITGILALRSKVRQLHLVLASKYAITKNIEVPSLNDEEIESIIRLQAVRHTPYSREEVIVGHINLEVLLERYTKALLVIVSNENIKKRTNALEIAGYEVQSVHLSAEVLAQAAQPNAGETPCGVAVLDADFTDFLVLHNAKPYFIRSIPTGLAQLKQDPASLRSLVDELKKTCEAYINEDQGTVLKKFLIGGVASPEREALAKTLAEEMKVPAEPLRLEEKLTLTDEAQAQLKQFSQVSFSDVIADGLIEQASIDLLPEDLRTQKLFRKKGKELFTAAIFILAIFILLTCTFFTRYFFGKSRLNAITKSFEVKQKEADKLVALSEETRLVKDFKIKKGRALRVLGELQSILPEEMYLSEITLAGDGKVTVKGTSELMSRVFSFVTEFENNPYFVNVTSDYTKSRKENDRDVSDFGLSANWEEPSHGG